VLERGEGGWSWLFCHAGFRLLPPPFASIFLSLAYRATNIIAKGKEVRNENWHDGNDWLLGHQPPSRGVAKGVFGIKTPIGRTKVRKGKIKGKKLRKKSAHPLEEISVTVQCCGIIKCENFGRKV